MRQMVESGEVDHLVAERVWAETERALTEQQPTRFFQVLRECGALARVFPEIDALFGVPQPPQYHPEVDSGLHTMLVLAQATRLSADARVRFAALVHDLGKGSTPPAEWPKHLGHEELGVELVTELCRRLRVPNEYRELAVVVARYHLRCHKAAELRAATLLETLEAVDAFRRPERFEQFLLACEADMRGRTGWEEKPYPQGDMLRRAFAAANEIDTAAIAAEHKNLNGDAIGEKIRHARIAAIKGAQVV
jgi:tRNA nucleotidyltransferase (CCA-adding enzyme)